MILLWFFLGILLAFGIARYNKSNKLFWQLALSLVLGYAATVMYDRTFNGEEGSSVNSTQVYSTQVPVVTSGSLAYLLAGGTSLAPMKVTASELVSQDTLVETEFDAIPSMVFGRTRDQPISTIKQPPECLQKSILTHHDENNKRHRHSNVT